MLQQFYLRRSKNFNKSRYARNRQLARVIFYFAIYINILVIYGVFFVLYGLSFESDIFFLFLFVELLFSAMIYFFYLSMFTLIFIKFYNSLKSGFLLDFFFKKIIMFFFYRYIYIISLIFSEKFFIEHVFLYTQKFLKFTDNFVVSQSNEIVYAVLSVVLLLFICFLVLI